MCHLAKIKKYLKIVIIDCVKWCWDNKYDENREEPTDNMKFFDDLTRAFLVRCPNSVGEEIQLLLLSQENWNAFLKYFEAIIYNSTWSKQTD